MVCRAQNDQTKLIRISLKQPKPPLALKDCIVGITDALLQWYAQNRRILPWRVPPKESGDPYKVWLSEMMLQQTTVQTVTPYFLRFIQKWPDILALASASVEEVRTLWSGLGYYTRASYLHETAQKLVQQGAPRQWPQTPKEWRLFPGIGPYTADAVSAIAFQFPTLPVDGNVARVLQRLLNISEDSRGKQLKKIQEMARMWPAYIQAPWGDLTQSFMDFGAQICTPQAPRCETCFLAHLCSFKAQISKKGGTVPALPTPQKGPQPSLKPSVKKVAKTPLKPQRYSYALGFQDRLGKLYVETEREKRLLYGLLKVPMVELPEVPAVSSVPMIRALFSHFTENVYVLSSRLLEAAPQQVTFSQFIQGGHFSEASLPFLSTLQEAFPYFFKGQWLSLEELSNYPQSSMFMKIVKVL